MILRTRQEDSWVVVEIEDTGLGIPEEIQLKIFDPFFTSCWAGRMFALLSKLDICRLEW
ncbi:MAG: hypothetical protein KDJ52_14025 [Anaerolineae bacterium]|nr:hypothetical protein [Anaerolineae bacterium]